MMPINHNHGQIMKKELVSLPVISDARGNLTFIEGNNHVPFEIKRVYYLYNIPIGKTRGGHAHKKLEQVIIAISGSLNVTLDDGITKNTFHLDNPKQGLYVGPATWRDMDGFSSGTVALVLASRSYEVDDYIRNYDEFIEFVKNARGTQ